MLVNELLLCLALSILYSSGVLWVWESHRPMMVPWLEGGLVPLERKECEWELWKDFSSQSATYSESSMVFELGRRMVVWMGR